jgi:hypothetical protein
MLSVADFADDAVIGNADAESSLRRFGDGLVGTVAERVSGGLGVLGTVTAGCGHGRALVGVLSADQGWGEQPAVAEEADQRPGRVGQAEALAVPQCRTGQQVQRVPEQRLLRRRSD